MKKILCLICTILLTSTSILIPHKVNATELNGNVFRIYSLQNTLCQEVLDEFEQNYQNENYGKEIKVENREFATIDEMVSEIKSGKQKIDLVNIPNNFWKNMIARDELLPITTKSDAQTHLTTYQNIAPYIMENVERIQTEAIEQREDTETVEKNIYGVPLSWQTLGVLYNKKKISNTDIYSWGVLYKKSNVDSIIMKESMMENYIPSVIMANYNDGLKPFLNSSDYLNKLYEVVNNFSDYNVSMVREKMLSQRAEISPMFTNDLTKIKNGKQRVSVAWSNEAQVAIDEAKEKDVNLGFYVPREGSVLTINMLAVLKNRSTNQNIQVIRDFLEFINNESVAVKNMQETNKTSVVSTAYLLEEMSSLDYDAIETNYFFGNYSVNGTEKVSEILYPREQSIKVCTFFEPSLSDYEVINEMWNNFKINPISIVRTVVSVLMGSLVVLVVCYLIYKNVFKNRKSLFREVIDSEAEVNSVIDEDD